MNWKAVLDEVLPEGQSVIYKLDHSGDSKQYWNRNNPLDVGIAKAAYEQAKKGGYMVYRVTKVGNEEQKGEIMHQFDPTVEKMILAPPIAGGCNATRC